MKKTEDKIIKVNKGNINYPVGDFLVRLKNASMAKHKSVSTPLTKLAKNVAETLKKERYLEDVRVSGGILITDLAFHKKQPVLMDVKLVSKPGLRVYMNVDELAAKRTPSLLIISTPLGVLTSREAIKNRVGGEIIAEIL